MNDAWNTLTIPQAIVVAAVIVWFGIPSTRSIRRALNRIADAINDRGRNV